MTGEVRAVTRVQGAADPWETRLYIYIAQRVCTPWRGTRGGTLRSSKRLHRGNETGISLKGMVGGEKKFLADLPEGGHEAAAL